MEQQFLELLEVMKHYKAAFYREQEWYILEVIKDGTEIISSISLENFLFKIHLEYCRVIKP